FLAVLAQQHDRAAEVRIHELWHGQKEGRRQRRRRSHHSDDSARAAARKSSVNRFISSCLACSSGARRIEDGWTVAITRPPSRDNPASEGGKAAILPRCCVTLKPEPSRACAAVAPRQTMTAGLTSAISVSSHGRQAPISLARGFL